MTRYGAIPALAAAYFVTGKLALLLAIPPGYAAAVWPPAGIALAALLAYGNRVWPGVLLGSFLINIGVSFEAGALLRSIAVAVSIGAGASLQALAGAWLVRRFAGFPTAFDDAREVGAFLLLSGPVSCLVNASWSIGTLFLAGAIGLGEAGFSWFTWWVGDTIGALVFAPLALMWLGRAGINGRRRRAAVTLPLAISFALVVLLFVQASRWEQAHIRKHFVPDAGAAEPSAEYLLAHRNWQPWVVLAAGLLFTSLLGAFLLILTGRAGKVESLVEQRTRELEASNRSLLEQMALREQGEQALKEKNIELERANQAKDRFLANMSHELRTPLNAIIGFTGMLLMKLPGPLNQEQDKQLGTVQSSAKHLLSLINDLLDLAKIEAGKIQIKPEPLVCQTVIDEVSATLLPLATAKGLRLCTVAPHYPVRLTTDLRALKQIVLNLTNNAIKFTDSGSVTLAIEEKQHGVSADVEISVSDTGVGINPEHEDKLFHAFAQMDSTHREGTGLGLHLSQRLAQLLGGRIEFTSEHGKGSRFWITLPKKDESWPASS